MEFPSWTPQWVKDQFKADFIDDEGWEDEYGPESREQIERVIRSPDSTVLWAALSPYAERNDDFAPHVLSSLAASIWHGLWGFGHVEIKGADKRKIAKDVRRHADAIVKRLDCLTVPDGFAMNSISADYARAFANERLSDEVEFFHKLYNEESHVYVPLQALQRAIPAINYVAAGIVGDAMYRSLPEFLDGICDALDQWANREQDVTKPNDANAKRLYFIRQVARDFTRDFGRPMRKETLALAGVFFDCADLEEADISKLAPVRNRQISAG